MISVKEMGDPTMESGSPRYKIRECLLGTIGSVQCFVQNMVCPNSEGKLLTFTDTIKVTHLQTATETAATTAKDLCGIKDQVHSRNREDIFTRGTRQVAEKMWHSQDTKVGPTETGSTAFMVPKRLEDKGRTEMVKILEASKFQEISQFGLAILTTKMASTDSLASSGSETTKQTSKIKTVVAVIELC
ncbi:hypothetical protein AMECASPLE_025595 [Ameca splendens]|uniref:Uncharacterized protein n=1 Tax=Ameca splendens TaxID=208324 RepID=A0ABV0Y4K3_9TELE